MTDYDQATPLLSEYSRDCNEMSMLDGFLTETLQTSHTNTGRFPKETNYTTDTSLEESNFYLDIITPGLQHLIDLVPPQQQLIQQSQPNDNYFNQYGQFTAPLFSLEYINFPDVIYREQERKNNENYSQVLSPGQVSFTLNFGTKEAMDGVKNIKVFVKRSNEGWLTLKKNSKIAPHTEFSIVQETKYLVKINLDFVYKINETSVHEVSQSKTDGNNIFYLVIEVTNNHDHVVEENTKKFKLLEKIKKSEIRRKAGQKRSHPGSSSHNSIGNSTNTNLINSPQRISKFSANEGFIKAQSIVADHIETKTLEVDGLHMGKTISTPNGDIAYTFPIYNEKDLFEEGEIVGLVPNEIEGENYIIKKLSINNCEEAVLKGVITRSHYLQALVKKDSSVPTETICMMGVIPVQVLGSVESNDFLYASSYHPGRAISGNHLDSSDICDAAYIGIAVSSRKVAVNDESVGFVAAGVSVLESAGKYMLVQRLRDVEERFDGKIGVIQKSRRWSRKFAIGSGILTMVMFALLSFFLWQLLTPGSLYRYYVCRLGRKTDPKGSAFYNYIPDASIHSYPRVSGIEFTFDKLMDKFDNPSYPELKLTESNNSGVRYYFNIDRCAYGHNKNDLVSIYGPSMFAVDEKCFHVYKLNKNPLFSLAWIKYETVSWPLRRNIFCKPYSKWKNSIVGD